MLGVGVIVALAGWALQQRHDRRLRHVSTERHVTEAPEAIFAFWFAQRPQRFKQRDLFVQVMRTLGMSEDQWTELVMTTTSKVWGKRPESFGAALADEIENRMTWVDTGEDREKRYAQHEAKRRIAEITDRLRLLDRT